MADSTREYTRLLAPPGHSRAVDVPNWLVPQKLADGYIVDPYPDTRLELSDNLPGKHRGRPALVCGCGPSMGMVDPVQLAVWRQQAQPVVWATNHVWEIMGKARLPLPAADYLVVLDESFWDQKRDQLVGYLRKYPGCLLCLYRNPGQPMRYYEIRINMAAQPDTGPQYQVGHYWHGFSSAVAAVQMAMHAGCNPIYLLGQDCTVANGMTHGFGVRGERELAEKYPQGQMMLPAYNVLAEHAQQLGIEIVNLSPVSAIQNFPHRTLASLVAPTV